MRISPAVALVFWELMAFSMTAVSKGANRVPTSLFAMTSAFMCEGFWLKSTMVSLKWFEILW